MTPEARLKELTEQIEAAKQNKIRAEARMDELNRREQDILNRLQAKGFDPERLAEERQARETQRDDLLAKAEAILKGEVPAPLPEPPLTTSTTTPEDEPW